VCVCVVMTTFANRQSVSGTKQGRHIRPTPKDFVGGSERVLDFWMSAGEKYGWHG
jgi:hypothetical protein